MTKPADQEQLGASQPLVAVLTVVAKAPDHVLYGDIIDAETNDKTAFVGSAGVADAVTSWVRNGLRRGSLGGPPATDARPPDERGPRRGSRT